MPAPKFNESIILAAIDGFESQKVRIDAQIAELKAMLPGGRTQVMDGSAPAPRKRKFSPDALRRMKEAQQRRWAKVRGESEPSSSSATPEPAKPKRKLSAAGRRAISEATKRRWALKRAESKKAESPVAKKTATKKAAARASHAKTTKRKTTARRQKKAPSVPTPTAGQAAE
jgi:hypothetical protein